MTSDQLLEELGTMLGRCVKVIRELETENEELKARREWVGLTDEEIFALRDAHAAHLSWGVKDFARAIESTLKEKNHEPR